MAYYIAVIHKDPDSCYGVSFPDVPGVFTAGDAEFIEQSNDAVVAAVPFRVTAQAAE